LAVVCSGSICPRRNRADDPVLMEVERAPQDPTRDALRRTSDTFEISTSGTRCSDSATLEIRLIFRW
jgi:hypothetical protein